MKKWRESLFAKLFLSMLFVLTLSIAVCGGVFVGYLSANGYWSADGARISGRFLAKLHRDVSDIQDYLALKNTAKTDNGGSYETQLRLQELEKQLNVLAAGNLVWQVMDVNGDLLLSNLQTDDAPLVDAVGDSGLNHSEFTLQFYGENGAEISQPTRYKLAYGLRAGLPYADEYNRINGAFASLQRLYVPTLAVAVAGLLVSIGLFAFLLAAAGRRAGGETAALNPFDRIWLEVPLAALAAAGFLWVMAMASRDYVLFASSSVLTGGLFLITSMTIVRRAKARQLYNTTFWHLLVKYLATAVRHIHIVGRLIGVFLLYIVAQVVLIYMMDSDAGPLAVFIFIMGNLSILTLLVVIAVQYNRLKKATNQMAEGNLGVVVDEKTVPFFRQAAHNLNSSGSAIKIAVEHATASERMKSELITNVSHDIKTPLTSIINYVGLLKTTGITDPKALEYVDILEHKSKRLAQLMADLVEASKVTSGAVGVTMESINLGELVKQAGGEFESRFEERGIQLMSRLPGQPVLVYADGRHMWRVLDNLFSNAVKYALDSTRIYVDLADLGNEVVLSMKNISRDPLNLHPDELMERFTRGDRARVGEGSGLGLSIARSLMELQHGTLDLQIDGDLFKVVLTLRKM